MLTALLATALAIVVAQLLPAAQLRQRLFAWWPHWVRISAGRGPWGWLLSLGLPLALLGLLQWLLHDRWYGIAYVVLGLLSVVLCWGPRDLERDVEAVIYADDSSQRAQAQAALHGDMLEGGRGTASLIDSVAVALLRRALGVLFWFLLFGPVGALAYRLLVILALHPVLLSLPAGERLRGVLAVAEWPVAQLTVLSMALAGNFQPVLEAWNQAGRGRAPEVEALVGTALEAAMPVLDDVPDIDGVPLWDRAPSLRHAMQVCWRVVWLWMVLMALWLLAGWLG